MLLLGARVVTEHPFDVRQVCAEGRSAAHAGRDNIFVVAAAALATVRAPSGARVATLAASLSRDPGQSGLPREEQYLSFTAISIQGQSAEFTSKALDHWAYWNRVQLDLSRPAKPVDNCIVEAFNGSLRRECLSLHWFASLYEAQALL
ncbi:MAG: integrase core domain-containing protein, partial [Gemmatimonadaceae bacterium]